MDSSAYIHFTQKVQIAHEKQFYTSHCNVYVNNILQVVYELIIDSSLKPARPEKELTDWSVGNNAPSKGEASW
jgi:hypothetical protein